MSEALIAALEREKAAYVTAGKTDRAKQVDAAIAAAKGGKKQTTKAAEAPEKA